jgi:hypothetical protein
MSSLGGRRHFAWLSACLLSGALVACTPPSTGSEDPGTGSGGNNATASGGGTGTGAGGSSTGTGGTTGTGGSPITGGSGGAAAAGSGGSMGSGGSVGSGGASGEGGSGGSTGGSGGSAGDGGPAETGGGGSGGPPAGGPYKVTLVYSPDHNGLNIPQADPSLRNMVEILDSMKETHNIVPDRQIDDQAKAANLRDRALIIVGPNVRHSLVDPALKDIEVALMASKDLSGIARLGLGTPGNTDANQDSIKIIATDHPITAGFMTGNIKVMSTANAQRMVQWTNLGPGAKKLGTLVNNPNQFTIVAYEKGGEMAGGFKAPAKRIGFFWHRPSSATPDGAKLFKAAVEWAIKP